jgi:GWxTD domain-containing protein
MMVKTLLIPLRKAAMERSPTILKPSPAALCLIILFIVSCSPSPGLHFDDDLAIEAFYEQARLIMTNEELTVWKSLPDRDSRREFIEEFWKIRDPDPSTAENEAKEEFAERVRYANAWFGTYNPRRGQESRSETEEQSRRGWNEDRGRVYIVLGPPDTIQFIDPDGEQISFDGTRFRPGAERWTVEVWIYDRYRIAVVFRKSGGGVWTIESLDSHLLEVLDWAKLNWVSGDFREDIEQRFKFKAKFSGTGLRIIIPVDRISFDENFRAEFGLKVNVYRDGKKAGTIEETKSLEKSEDELFETKNIEFEIPFRAMEKGSYLFDVIVTDRMAPALSKYRTFVKGKL